MTAVCPECLCTPATFCADPCPCHRPTRTVPICPNCHDRLQSEIDGYRCRGCGRFYDFRDHHETAEVDDDD